MSKTDRAWGWDVSALLYEKTYGPLAHQLDDEVLSHLGERLAGAVVADCGCGPGVVAQKLLQRGAACVFAIDASFAMLRQVPPRAGLEPVLGRVTPELLAALSLRVEPAGFDLVLFKRSLYQRPAEARALLRAARSLLRARGEIVIVHPEGDWRRYAFGAPFRWRRCTPYHLVNRALSLGAVWARAEQYALYTRDELRALVEGVAGASSVQILPSAQASFNLIALRGSP